MGRVPVNGMTKSPCALAVPVGRSTAPTGEKMQPVQADTRMWPPVLAVTVMRYVWPKTPVNRHQSKSCGEGNSNSVLVTVTPTGRIEPSPQLSPGLSGVTTAGDDTPPTPAPPTPRTTGSQQVGNPSVVYSTGL